MEHESNGNEEFKRMDIPFFIHGIQNGIFRKKGTQIPSFPPWFTWMISYETEPGILSWIVCSTCTSLFSTSLCLRYSVWSEIALKLAISNNSIGGRIPWGWSLIPQGFRIRSHLLAWLSSFGFCSRDRSLAWAFVLSCICHTAFRLNMTSFRSCGFPYMYLSRDIWCILHVLKLFRHCCMFGIRVFPWRQQVSFSCFRDMLPLWSHPICQPCRMYRMKLSWFHGYHIERLPCLRSWSNWIYSLNLNLSELILYGVMLERPIDSSVCVIRIWPSEVSHHPETAHVLVWGVFRVSRWPWTGIWGNYHRGGSSMMDMF